MARLAPRGAPELDEHRVTYTRNREILLAGLKEAGLTNTAPADGAFYVYADVGHLTDDSRALSWQILDEAGVAVTPGLDFDKARGHRTLRFSYARGTAEIEEGVARLTRFFRARLSPRIPRLGDAARSARASSTKPIRDEPVRRAVHLLTAACAALFLRPVSGVVRSAVLRRARPRRAVRDRGRGAGVTR